MVGRFLGAVLKAYTIAVLIHHTALKVHPSEPHSNKMILIPF